MADVVGAIYDRWVRLRRTIGQPLAVEHPTFDTIGRTQEFERGTISWHPETHPAYAVREPIRSKWLALERELYGYPVSDTQSCEDRRGRYNRFRTVHLPGLPEAAIYWTDETGACEVRGRIYAEWALRGFERSPLGYPTSDELDGPGGVRRSTFEHGHIDWKDGHVHVHTDLIDEG